MKYVCSQKSSKVRLSKAKVKQLINLQLTQLALRAKSNKSVQRATGGGKERRRGSEKEEATVDGARCSFDCRQVLGTEMNVRNFVWPKCTERERVNYLADKVARHRHPPTPPPPCNSTPAKSNKRQRLPPASLSAKRRQIRRMPERTYDCPRGTPLPPSPPVLCLEQPCVCVYVCVCLQQFTAWQTN